MAADGQEGEKVEEGGGEEEGEESSVPLTTVELFVQREEKLAKKKESIAAIVSQLMENPEGNVGKDIGCLYEFQGCKFCRYLS